MTYIVKKILLALTIATLAMVSCQNDSWNLFGHDNNVEVVLNVKSPQMQTLRSETSGLDSALGAIDNFDNNSELWEEYDLRYILEIYEVVTNGSTTTISTNPIYKRQVQTTDNYYADGVDFKMLLVPNRTYKFVLWADFVDEDTEGDLYYNTSDLRAITRKSDYAHTAMEEALDAYHISVSREIKSATELPLTLTRPMAKLRVVAIDHSEISNYSTPTQVSVTFDTENNPVYKTFDAVDNKILNNCVAHTYNYSIDPAPYRAYKGKTTEGADISGLVLFSDYIFAQREITEGEKNEQAVSFSMTVTFDNNENIKHTVDFDTQIPLNRNYLTTVIGNCLTQQESLVFNIDDTLLSGEEVTVE